jgi:hypothetical protein
MSHCLDHIHNTYEIVDTCSLQQRPTHSPIGPTLRRHETTRQMALSRTVTPTNMLALDYKIDAIDIEHRRSLLTLLKLEFGSFEPAYVKVPQLSRLAGQKPNTQNADESIKPFVPFGMLVLLHSDQRAVSDVETFAEVNSIKIEIYHDREEMDLICAGQRLDLATFTSEPYFSCIKTQPELSCRDDPLVKSAESFIKLLAVRTLTVPMFHKAQGRFQIHAGDISLTIRLYEFDVKDCLKSSAHVTSPSQSPVGTDSSGLLPKCQCNLRATDTGHSECAHSMRNR